MKELKNWHEKFVNDQHISNVAIMRAGTLDFNICTDFPIPIPLDYKDKTKSIDKLCREFLNRVPLVEVISVAFDIILFTQGTGICWTARAFITSSKQCAIVEVVDAEKKLTHHFSVEQPKWFEVENAFVGDYEATFPKVAHKPSLYTH